MKIPLALVLLSGAALAENAPPARHVVARERLRLAPVRGTFVGAWLGEFRYLPEAGGESVPVLEVRPPGAAARKGEVLLKLDPSRLDEAIGEAETAERAAAEGARLAGEELKAQRISDGAGLAGAEAETGLAEQQLKAFREIQAPLQRREAALATLGAVHSLSDQRQELEQLETMYKASELAQSTKEIVLERARRDVERLKEHVEIQRRKEEAALPQELSQQEAQFAAAAAQKRAALDAARLSSPSQTARKALEAAAAVSEMKKARERLAALRRDKERLTITSPSDGIVVHGPARSLRGPLGAPRLSTGDRAEPFSPLLTLMSAEAGLVTCPRVPATRILDFPVGQKVLVSPTADPRREMKGTVREVSPLPSLSSEDGQETFYQVTVALSGRDAGVRPGFEAEVRPAEPAEVAAVPSKAVQHDGNRALCQVVGKDGKPQAREVTMGSADGDLVQVTGGLEPGETVLIEAEGK